MDAVGKRFLFYHGLGFALLGSLMSLIAYEGYQVGAGRFHFLRGNDVGAVGFFEAYGLAAIIGLIVLVGSREKENKVFHLIAAIPHFFLFLINIRFWHLYETLNLVVAGYVSTAMHLILSLSEFGLYCLRSKATEKRRNCEHTDF